MVEHDVESWEAVLPHDKVLPLTHQRCHIPSRQAVATVHISGLRGTISDFAVSSGAAGPARLVELP
jgi:hypothetical protein